VELSCARRELGNLILGYYVSAEIDDKRVFPCCARFSFLLPLSFINISALFNASASSRASSNQDEDDDDIHVDSWLSGHHMPSTM
jgi:hypothetical protein